MATTKKETKEVKEREYIVKVKGNPSYCGEGAGGAQFAHGEAKITDTWLAEWYRTHEGYVVEEVAEVKNQENPDEK